ncbi:MAG TPA: hypothetical protein VGK90_02255 [Rhizomicrobium sp.]|jgi:hypothetical protein
MHHRFSLASFLLAGVTALATSASAQVVVHHPVAHPHPVIHRPPVVGVHAGIRPIGPHGSVRVGVGGLHPFHAALIGHVGFAHFTPAQRAVWTRGHWYHRWYNGHYGWWWFTGGTWFWYNAPVYPYPTVVSENYYEESDYSEPGPTWYYCYNPAGYYPYVPRCYGPWRPVPAQGYGYDESTPDQGPPPDQQQYDDQQAPPPGYGEGPPPGYEQGPPPGYEQGAPPGYGPEPPSGYDQGPPPGYDQGPPPGYDDQQGPPPPDANQGNPKTQQEHQ